MNPANKRSQAERAMAIRMLRTGASNEVIAAKLKVDPATIGRWGREAGVRPLEQQKAAALKLLAMDKTPHQVAKELRISSGLVSQWRDEQKALERANVGDYRVMRAAELLRQGFSVEEVVSIVKLPVEIVGGINPKKVPVIDRTERRHGEGALPTLDLKDFVHVGYDNPW